MKLFIGLMKGGLGEPLTRAACRRRLQSKHLSMLERASFSQNNKQSSLGRLVHARACARSYPCPGRSPQPFYRPHKVISKCAVARKMALSGCSGVPNFVYSFLQWLCAHVSSLHIAALVVDENRNANCLSTSKMTQKACIPTHVPERACRDMDWTAMKWEAEKTNFYPTSWTPQGCKMLACWARFEGVAPLYDILRVQVQTTSR